LGFERALEPPLGPWLLKKPFLEVLTEKNLQSDQLLQESYRSMITARANYKGSIELNAAEQRLQSHLMRNGILKYPLEAKTVWLFNLNTMRWELNLAAS